MLKKQIDLTQIPHTRPLALPMFGAENGQETLAVNSRYFIRNGEPFFPIMGEFHFSRCPAEAWEEELCKIRAGGIQIVASYVIWIHHEEERNVFDWTGCRNLRRFLTLCKKNGLRVLLRIGPWSHGECRNGGFPDWLIRDGIPLRQNDPSYLEYVRTFYTQIFKQARGLFFRDGGPIIGVQIENEYGHCGGLQGKAGIAHIKKLKDMAVRIGFDVPFYTSTGWGNGVVVEGETLPVLGGYAEAPWEQHTHERRAAPEYLFRKIHRETSIGTDFSGGMQGQYAYDITRYPYLTAELGGGLEPTHHRRPCISADDTGALAFAFLASGTNLLGYYMYHGGVNPHGKYTTLQESRETGYPNDVPAYSYDFQAPISAYGFLRGSYNRLKCLHLFLRDFGDCMALTSCCLGKDNARDPEDLSGLRYSVRSGTRGGFLFLSNYQRRRRMQEKTDLCVAVRTPEAVYSFEHICLPDRRYVFYPFAMNLDGIFLSTATAQPLCRLHGSGETTFVFLADTDTPAVFRFRSDTLQNKENMYPGADGCMEWHADCARWGQIFHVKRADGRPVSLLVVSRRDAYRAWKIRCGTEEHLVLTDAALRCEKRQMVLTSTEQQVPLLAYPPLPETMQNALGSDCRYGDFSGGMLPFEPLKHLPSVQVEPGKRQEDGSMLYTLSVTRSVDEAADDDRLVIRFYGDRASLSVDRREVDDWFYTGDDWTVGLKRFGPMREKTMQLYLYPLRETDPVFLEKRPVFTDGTACSLCSVEIQPEYICRIPCTGIEMG